MILWGPLRQVLGISCKAQVKLGQFEDSLAEQPGRPDVFRSNFVKNVTCIHMYSYVTLLWFEKRMPREHHSRINLTAGVKAIAAHTLEFHQQWTLKNMKHHERSCVSTFVHFQHAPQLQLNGQICIELYAWTEANWKLQSTIPAITMGLLWIRFEF